MEFFETNFNLALEYLNDKFAPDLNSMEVQDHAFLNNQKKIAEAMAVMAIALEEMEAKGGGICTIYNHISTKKAKRCVPPHCID